MTGAQNNCMYYDGHRSIRKGSIFQNTGGSSNPMDSVQHAEMMVQRLPYSVKFDNGLDVNRAGLCERLKPKCVLLLL